MNKPKPHVVDQLHDSISLDVAVAVAVSWPCGWPRPSAEAARPDKVRDWHQLQPEVCIYFYKLVATIVVVGFCRHAHAHAPPLAAPLSLERSRPDYPAVLKSF